MPPTLAVAFALDAEFAPWRARRRFTPAPVRGCFEAVVEGTTVRAALVGVAARRLALVTPWLLASDTDVLVSAGLCGGLTPRYDVGDVLVASMVRRGTSRLDVNARLVAHAVACGARSVLASVTRDDIAATARQKRALAPDGDWVDTESFDLIERARQRGIAGLAIRAVGDAATDDLPMDFSRAIRRDGSMSTGALAVQAILSPWRWPRLARFARDQVSALNALVPVLDRFAATLESSIESR